MTQASSGSFYIPSQRREELQQERGLSSQELLRTLVGEVQGRALVPISNFRVGAAGLNAAGDIFLGVNLEFTGASFAQTVHAEQFLVCLSRARSASPLIQIAVSAPPCGHCRQFLNEFDARGELSVLIGEEPSMPLKGLLPRAFGPADLQVDTPFYSSPPEPSDLTDCYIAAQAAARHSYAPYSGNRAGAAIQTTSGAIFIGSALENAAYNPALPPLQGALVAAYAEGASPDSIRRVVLCQELATLIDHEPQDRALAQIVSGGRAAFEIVALSEDFPGSSGRRA